MATKKKAGIKKIVEKKQKVIVVSKPKRSISTAQYNAAIKNLEKARIAKKRYERMREEWGLTRENAAEAGEIISGVLNRFTEYGIENNPAVAQLMDAIGDFATPSEIASMKNKDFYRYATALRVFLNSPLSDMGRYKKSIDSIISETVGNVFNRQPDEDINAYKRRRRDFISEHEDTMKKAFELYRRVEETNAGQILRDISPSAYGSENLITDITTFVETEWDGDMEKAADFWRDRVMERYTEAIQKARHFSGKLMEVTRYDWRRQYAEWTPESNKRKRARRNK